MKAAVVLCLMSFLSLQPGAQRTERQVIAAKNFKFEGIGLSTTVNQLKLLHPTIDVEKGAIPELLEFAIPSKSASVVKVSALHDKPYKIAVLYSPSDLKKIGGGMVLLDKMVEKIGSPDKDESEIINQVDVRTFEWNYNEFGVKYKLGMVKGNCVLYITNTILEEKLNALVKSRAEVGF